MPFESTEIYMKLGTCGKLSVEHLSLYF